LRDVYADIAHIAGIMDAKEQAQAVISEMQVAIEAARAIAAEAIAKRGRPLVYCEEWGKPLIHSQVWVAELVDAAGGRFLGTPGAHTNAEAIREANPDVIIAAWCGAGDRVPLEKIIDARAWAETNAGEERRIYV